ncbi:MAG: glycosyltransferase family 4 protein [Fuerstiella sp.]|nr:glycosyltransferase family 4 protein [Fuerstiella sp.]
MRLTAIPNCVDTEKFAPRLPDEKLLRAVVPKDAFVMLCCARLTANKGIVYLLHAMAGVYETHPHVHLILAGDGELRNELEATASELGIADHVHFTGYLSDVRASLTQCDVYIQPSLVEGLPISVLEAMSMGKPVIATAVSGTPEIVRHEQTGLCVPPADPDALRKAIVRFVEQPTVREAMAKTGRILISHEYSLHSLRNRLQRLYSELLEDAA